MRSRRDFRPVVYICHPYTKGHVNANVNSSCDHWNYLFKHNFCIPINPLWSHMQDLVRPLSWEEWMKYDISLFEAGIIEAVYVAPSEIESMGVELEIKKAEELGIPVFRSFTELAKWCQSFKVSKENANGDEEEGDKHQACCRTSAGS